MISSWTRALPIHPSRGTSEDLRTDTSGARPAVERSTDVDILPWRNLTEPPCQVCPAGLSLLQQSIINAVIRDVLVAEMVPCRLNYYCRTSRHVTSSTYGDETIPSLSEGGA